MTTVTTTAIQQLLRIRLVVAALGERLPKPWWRSQFLTSTGLRYMARIFPRRPLAAALESVTVAARREHDANVGAQSYHLFRLPSQLEDQLAETIRDSGLDASDLPDSTEGLTGALAQFGSGISLSSGSGPKSLGCIKEVLNPTTLGRIAKLYATAVQQETRIYPYFDEAGDD